MLFRNKTSAAFFEERYRRNGDPWNFSESDYEQGRYSTIIAALSPGRYRRAFEPGCSVGVLTEMLAALCDRVDASDFSETAASEARKRCAYLPGVAVTCAALTDNTPVGGYDLIVLSEIGYYFRPNKWRAAVAKLTASMDPATTVLASHWLGHSKDHVMEGDQVHEILRAEPLLRLEHEERHAGFRLDRFVRL